MVLIPFLSILLPSLVGDTHLSSSFANKELDDLSLTNSVLHNDVERQLGDGQPTLDSGLPFRSLILIAQQPQPLHPPLE